MSSCHKKNNNDNYSITDTVGVIICLHVNRAMTVSLTACVCDCLSACKQGDDSVTDSLCVCDCLSACHEMNSRVS